MKKIIYLMLLLFFAVVLVGCQRTNQRTEPVVLEPPSRIPAEDVPPKPERQDAYQEKSVKPPFKPAVSTEDKSSLLYYAKLDLLRILICSEEQIQTGSEKYNADTMLQAAVEYFTDVGFKVIDGSPCPDYSSTAATLGAVANQRDVDMYVLLKAEARQIDKFGDFYSFEADGSGKVAQISDKELLTVKSALVRGKRGLDQRQAAESAMTKCGKELAQKLSDEILRKSARGILLRRVRIDGLSKAEHVDYVRIGLSKKPGIQSVTLKSWDAQTGRAIFWIRLDASVKENLAAYLEEIENIKLKVERLDKSEIESHKKGLLE